MRETWHPVSERNDVAVANTKVGANIYIALEQSEVHALCVVLCSAVLYSEIYLTT